MSEGTNSVTGQYQKVGQVSLAKNTPSSLPSSEAPSKGKSFADVLLIDPAKNALEASKSAETAALLSTTGEIDELTVAQLINEADAELQKFKTIWEKTLQSLNELPRVSM